MIPNWSAGSAVGTMAQSNPKYPNATIVEALCEIHLERGEGAGAFTLVRPLEFYNCVASSFPSMEIKNERAMTWSLSSDGQPLYESTDSPRLLFFNPDRTSLLQLGDGGRVLSFNVLKPYVGWENMRDMLIDTWKRAVGVLKPEAIVQVGLRYINRVERSDDAELKLSDWLRANEFLPAAFVNSSSPYNLAFAVVDGERYSNIRVHSSPESDAALIFDIDVVWKSRISPTVEELLPILERLHEQEWSVFRESITETYEKFLSTDEN